MWLRSQNGKRLVNVNMIVAEKGTGNCCVVASVDGNIDNSFIAGEYETEERALEIINEIQERIISNQIASKLSSDNEKKGMSLSEARDYALYEMPIK